MHLDQILVELSAAAYTDAPRWSVGDVHAISKDLAPDWTVVAFRGTACFQDALRDAKGWPSGDPALGFVHTGFLTGARLTVEQIRADLLGKKVIFTGHSLGGALALVTAAFFTHGITFRPRFWSPVTDVVTFGAPRAGFRQMRRILAPVQVRQYWAGDDPVPCVPWLCGCYVHMRDPFHLDVPWAIDPIDDHSDVKVYAKAVAALVPADAPPLAASAAAD